MFQQALRMWGIARSLAIYRGIPWRPRQLRKLYREFLRPGELGFDLGAHAGSRVKVWRALGARVVAVEPQPDFLWLLRRFHGGDPEVMIVGKAVGAAAGHAELAVSSATPTVSSLVDSWRATVQSARSFQRVTWDRSVAVEVVTLDALIDEYGEPAFCKIDVEGAEPAALSGLSRPLRALSFEYLPEASASANEVVERLERLGAQARGYEYNYSPVETARFASPRWVAAEELDELLAPFRGRGRSGDIYARLRR